MRKLFFTNILLILLIQNLSLASDKPNIIWLVSEDNSARYLPMYGQNHAYTPTLSKLAQMGNVYNNAYSNASVCASSRSGILTGVHSVSTATHNHRSRYPIVQNIKNYVHYFKNAGYYCTNNSKTDYNILMDDKKIWDASSPKAHFKNRPKDKPFLAVFNFGDTHESCLFPQNVEKNRALNNIPKTPSTKLKDIKLPKYLPNSDIYRNDMAIYLDDMHLLDTKISKILAELADEGNEVLNNTIIFYYSDHGGILPRQKRNLFNDSTQVPLIVYIPPKFKNLNPFENVKNVEEAVNLVDLAPTIMSLIGVAKPQYMQGRAFLGEHRQNPKTPYSFSYSGRFDEKSYFLRAVNDNQFRYIRNFYSYLPPMVWADYALNIPSWTNFKELAQDNKLSKDLESIWKTQKSDFLYNTKKDFDEINNLAYQKNSQPKLKDMQNAMKNFMINFKDAGILPEEDYPQIIQKYGTVMNFLNSDDFNYQEILDMAWKASEMNEDLLDELKNATNSKNKYIRYWAAIGLLNFQNSEADYSKEMQNLKSYSEELDLFLIAMLKSYNLNTRAEGISELENLLNNSKSAISIARIISELENLNFDKDKILNYKTKFAKELKILSSGL